MAGSAKRPSIKDVRTKSRKIDLPLVCKIPTLVQPPLMRKMFALAQPPPPCPCGYIINFEKSEIFCHKFRKIRRFLCQKVRTAASKEPLPSLSAKCPNWTNPHPPLTADVFYGRPIPISIRLTHGLFWISFWSLSLACDK